jgi:3-oxoacyl-[acyl-carrier protein] reductase
MTFAGRVVLVTGAARGIGRAIAAAFAGEKASVVLNDVGPQDRLQAVAGELSAATACRVIVIAADVKRYDEVQEMVRHVGREFGRLDVLVNNAGIIRRGSIETVTEQDWDDVIGVNLKGAFNCCKAAADIMIRQRYGKMINVSSVAAKTGDITSAPGYGPSKAGMDALTKTLARQLAHYGINVNGVAPHAIETDMSAEWPPEKRKAIIEAIPLKRLGKPEDVAEAVLFLASEKAAFITGEILDVNGGFIMD